MSNVKEMIPLKGRIKAVLKDKNGNIKQEEKKENTIVNQGKFGIVEQLLNSPAIAVPSHMELGEGSTATTATDLSLELGLGGRQTVSKTRTDNEIEFVGIFGPDESTGSITEAGIFNSATGGDMYSRVTFGVITKEAEDTLELTWTWTIG